MSIVPKRLNGFYRLRWQILKRDKFTCQYCGQSAPNVKLEVDHKVSLSEGGTDDKDNLITACYACNRGKGGLQQSLIKAGSSLSPIDRVKGKKTMEVYELTRQGSHRVKDMAQLLNTGENTIRVIQFRLRKYGLLRPSTYREKRKMVMNEPQRVSSTSRPVKTTCATCGGRKWVEVKTGDTVVYKPCPDCRTSK